MEVMERETVKGGFPGECAAGVGSRGGSGLEEEGRRRVKSLGRDEEGLWKWKGSGVERSCSHEGGP